MPVVTLDVVVLAELSNELTKQIEANSFNLKVYITTTFCIASVSLFLAVLALSR